MSDGSHLMIVTKRSHWSAVVACAAGEWMEFTALPDDYDQTCVLIWLRLDLAAS
jgi:hypothetical protein